MKTTAPLRHLLFCVLLAGALLVRADDGSRWQTSGYLVDTFVEVALRSEYSTRRNPVRKWSGAVSYFIVHNVGEEDLHRKLIETHFRHLGDITGLAIRPVESQAMANFLVVLTREDKLEADLPRYFGTGAALQHQNLFRHSICLATFATERKGSIVRAVAMIPVDTARASGGLASCVVEELTHAMGLPNDSLKVFPSIFSRKSNHAYLTGLDHLMLRMLYDPRIKAGMDEKSARPMLRTIAAEYQRDNRFALAEQSAAEDGLAGLDR